MPRAASEPAPGLKGETLGAGSGIIATQSPNSPCRWSMGQPVSAEARVIAQAGGHTKALGRLPNDIEQWLFSRDRPKALSAGTASKCGDESQGLAYTTSPWATKGNSPAPSEEPYPTDGTQFWRGGEDTTAMVGSFTNEAAWYVPSKGQYDERHIHRLTQS